MKTTIFGHTIPDKIQRMNAYLYAWAILTDCIEDIEPINQNLLCCIISDYHYYTGLGRISAFDVGDLYPELKKQRPYTFKEYWWPLGDKQSRILALENAIKLLND